MSDWCPCCWWSLRPWHFFPNMVGGKLCPWKERGALIRWNVFMYGIYNCVILCQLFQQHIVEGQHADVSKCWLVVWLKVQARQAEARRRAEEEAFEIQLPDASPATVAVQTDMRLVVALFVSVTRNDSYESQFLSFPFLGVIVETNWIHGWLTWVGACLWRSFFCRQGLRSSVEWRRKRLLETLVKSERIV